MYRQQEWQALGYVSGCMIRLSTTLTLPLSLSLGHSDEDLLYGQDPS